MPLVLDGDTGIVGVLLTDANGNVTFDTNTLYVDAPNNKVGIGETSPLGKLHVKDGDAGSITTNGAHDTIIVEGSDNTGINIFSPNTSYQYLTFGDTENSNSGYIRYQHSNDQMVLRAGSSDTVYIKSSKVGIGAPDPDRALTIEGSDFSSSSIRLKRTSGGTNNDAGLQFESAAGANADTGLGGIWFQNSHDGLTYALIRARTDDSTGTSGRLDFMTGTSVVNNSTTPNMTIKSSGYVGIGTTNPTGKLHVYDSGVLDINLVGNPPELNLEDTSSSSGAKRARLTVDTGFIYIQGLSDDDQSVTHTFLRGDLSNGDLYLENVNGHQLSHRNLINNGGMQIAQRNASYTITTSGYQYNCLDRWGNYYAGTTVGQQEQIVFNQLKKVMRITATTSVSNLYTFQWIENGGKILCNGERFSISFKARSSVASGKTCTVQMRYGNAGAGNTAQSDTLGSAALTNSFQQFRFENVDASSFNYTQAGLWLWMPGPSLGDYIEITDVQIELGSNATQFEQKSISQEMNDCMRFYQRLQGNRDGSGGAAGDRGIFHMHNWNATTWYGPHHFNVPMRTGPTLKTGYDGTYLGTWYSGGNTSNATSIQIQNSNPWRAELSGNHTTNFLAGGSCWLRLGSDNDYVAFDAEHL